MIKILYKFSLQAKFFSNLAKIPLNSIVSKKSYQIVQDHYKLRIPFHDFSFYSNLFEILKVEGKENLTAWDIIEKYIKLNIHELPKEFILSVLNEFSLLSIKSTEFWYYAEKRMTSEIKSLNNQELCILGSSFSNLQKGSVYFWRMLSEEFLNRDIRKYTKKEFEIISEAFKNIGFDQENEYLGIFLEKAKIEIFSH